MSVPPGARACLLAPFPFSPATAAAAREQSRDTSGAASLLRGIGWSSWARGTGCRDGEYRGPRQRGPRPGYAYASQIPNRASDSAVRCVIRSLLRSHCHCRVRQGAMNMVARPAACTVGVPGRALVSSVCFALGGWVVHLCCTDVEPVDSENHSSRHHQRKCKNSPMDIWGDVAVVGPLY